MKLCCQNGSDYICGGPGSWDFGDNLPTIGYCPWCGIKLPEKMIQTWDCVVRYNRGLGPEFISVKVTADTKNEAISAAEKEATVLLEKSHSGLKFNILGTQVSPIKAA